MDKNIGAKELVTQRRLIELLDKKAYSHSSGVLEDTETVVYQSRSAMPYTYIGNLADKTDNSNIDEFALKLYLQKKGYAASEIQSAIFKLKQAADNIEVGLYEANKAVYSLLRYGVNVNSDDSENMKFVKLIDWDQPFENNFTVAEEVTINGDSERRPDLVIYVNGIALVVIELKRSKVSVHEGIRQNIRNQEPGYIQKFFTTVQLLFAGNDTEGLYYGVIKTPEKFWLRWKEPCGDPCGKSVFTPEKYSIELDRSVLQFLQPQRLLWFIQYCIVFDAGIKKAARPNQFFALQAAQTRVTDKDKGIIWHSQGSGKSLTMIWLAKWIRDNQKDARVVIITDRDELDKQIESVFKGTDENISRAKSGDELVTMLNHANPWLICTLIHKFGAKDEPDSIQIGSKKAAKSLEAYLEDVADKLPADYSPKGNIFVFVDECHRSQTGLLHEAMLKIVGENAMLIGFTGTPLLKSDKKSSFETFGSYIHTYKFDEAVKDGVVLDLQYEPRDVPQYLGKKEKIDEWFRTKTQGLSSVARLQLKERWAQLEKLFSSKERMERIVADICMDMDNKRALSAGYGNAMLVADSIYQACRYWELFQNTPLKGHCAVVTSYDASTASVKDEYTGDGETEDLHKYETYKKMLGDKTPEQYEAWAKKEFIDNPASMKLLIVVDKLLTGFDAPSATYLYIDKKMRDHGLFQAVCRVNRVDSEEKDYGYIIDYQDLFGNLQDAVSDYTNGAFDKYDKEDVAGLMKNRLEVARKDLEEALQNVITLCDEANPQTREGFFAYFAYKETTPADRQMAECDENAAKRTTLYRMVSHLVRCYIDIANEMEEAGYTPEQAADIKKKVDFYNDLKDEIKLKSGDSLDLKYYDPAMRQLIDQYVRAEDSEKLADLADVSLLDLVYLSGCDADTLKKKSKRDERSVAEILVANARKIIISEHATNPKYYDEMSAILNQLIEDQKADKIKYKDLIEGIIARLKEMKSHSESRYPSSMDTSGKKALYDNLDNDESLVEAVHKAVKDSAKDRWRDISGAAGMKMKAVRRAVRKALPDDTSEERFNEIMEIIINQSEY